MIYTKISLLFCSEQKVPYFIGSQIRGAFGYSLKKTVCINPSYKCDNCFASDRCLYYQFYEQKNVFHKYRLDFKLGSLCYDFSLYLFDKDTHQLPYIISALHTMLTKVGLTKDRITYKKFDIYINDEKSLIDDKIELPKNTIKTFQIDNICQDIILNLVTPLRMKKNNKYIRDDNIELKDIINSIYQRQMKILGNGYRKFPFKIKGNIVLKEINYKELTRRSNRQKTTMNLGGIMGKIKIENLNKECYEVLKVGELIGVGKSTVFGLGKIEIEGLKCK